MTFKQIESLNRGLVRAAVVDNAVVIQHGSQQVTLLPNAARALRDWLSRALRDADTVRVPRAALSAKAVEWWPTDQIIGWDKCLEHIRDAALEASPNDPIDKGVGK